MKTKKINLKKLNKALIICNTLVIVLIISITSFQIVYAMNQPAQAAGGGGGGGNAKNSQEKHCYYCAVNDGTAMFSWTTEEVINNTLNKACQNRTNNVYKILSQITTQNNCSMKGLKATQNSESSSSSTTSSGSTKCESGSVIGTYNGMSDRNPILGIAVNYAEGLSTGVTYTSHQFHVSIGGKRFSAYCLDPGQPNPTKSSLCCSPVSSSEVGLQYLLAQADSGNYDPHTLLLAFRFYGQHINADGSTTSHSSDAIIAKAIKNQVSYGAGTFVLKATASASDQNLYNTAWTLAQNAINANAADLEAQLNGDESNVGTTATISETEKDVQNMTATLELKFKSPTTGSEKLSCDGCTIDEGESVAPNIKTLTVHIHATACDYTLKLTTKIYGAFRCQQDDDHQSYYVYVGESDGVGSEYTGELCETCILDNQPKPLNGGAVSSDYVDGSLNNCCLNGDEAVLSQYKLDDVLSRDNCLQVNGYLENVGADFYSDTDANGNYSSGDLDDDYCELYCTQRAQVNIPNGVSAVNGLYFELESQTVNVLQTSVTTTGSVIQGYKRCRVKTDYASWLKDYTDQVKIEIEQYNIYQHYKTIHELLTDVLDNYTTYNIPITLKIECPAVSDSPMDCCSYQYDGKGSYWCTSTDSVELSCPQDGDEASGTYDRYDFTAHPVSDKLWRDWYEVKLDPTELRTVSSSYQYYNNIVIKPDKEETYDKHYPKVVWDLQSIVDEAATKKSNLESPACAEGYTCGGMYYHDLHYSCTVSGQTEDFSGELSLKYENYNVKNEQIEAYTNYTNAATAYENSTKEAKTLENKLYVCDNYFGQFSGANAEERFQFDPDSSFEYSQIYLNDFGELKKAETGVEFEKVCVTDKVEVSDTSIYKNTGFYRGLSDGNDNLQTTQYSSIFGSGTASLTDFRCTADQNDGIQNSTYQSGYSEPGCATLSALGESTKSNTEYTKSLDKTYNASKQFTTDARYHVYCYWEEQDNTKYTLAEYGDVSYDTKNYTVHNKQYEVYLTTLEGTFETHWYTSNVGEDGIFDDYINQNGTTCAGESEYDDGFSQFSCKLKVSHGMIHTGKCSNGYSAVNNIEDCNRSDINSEGYVLYNFKIVDPDNMFPECNSQNPTDCYYSMGEQHAYNWLVDSTGVSRLAELQSDTTYDPDNITYSFILTNSDMKQIKEYNDKALSSGGYTDFELTCQKTCNSTQSTSRVSGTNSVISNDSCNACYSEFLSNLASGNVEYDGVSHKVTGWSNDNKTLNEIRASSW